ncbi:MAG TPA: DNA double-strand break repair nuclease NurA [Anaerolineae bacterium]|nr:DNA double-strand break repair nuclease NurA [Anaerolineae bacterium]
MPETFIAQLSDTLTKKRSELKTNLHNSGKRIDAEFRAAVLDHWHSPLPPRANGQKRPAYAIDGSRRRANLTNGSTVFVAQALIMGEDINEPVTDVEILPGTVRAETMDRFADLMLRELEIHLAREYVEKIPEGSILYLDGAIYGMLPQLYPLRSEGIPEDRDYATMLLEDYRTLFDVCESRHIVLVAVSKTNRQALFSKKLQLQMGRSEIMEISDSALFDELTERKIGYSTPLLLGKYSFEQGKSNVVLEGANVQDEPAILSFFVRLDDMDDALRVDVPSVCVGRKERIGDLEWDLVIPPDCIIPIVQLLSSDYGGLQVYNALMYVTDMEVRLSKDKMYNIYLPMVSEVLGEELRIDRSERRFVE